MSSFFTISTATAPEWLLLTLATLFFSGFVFYLLRFLSPDMVRNTYGFYDIENEVGHGICMLSMTSMLAPALLPIGNLVWALVLGAGSLWFLGRALTWGRKLVYNKAWWDWAHVGMFAGMAVMFVDLSQYSFIALNVFIASVVFWGWFTYHYGIEFVADLQKPRALYLGSDMAHFFMGATMLVMTLFPALLMPAHGHHGGPTPAVVKPVPGSASDQFVTRVNDASIQGEVFASGQPVIVLVFGGCEKCAVELPLFRQVAQEYAGKARFVMINKDDAPAACKALAVTECPVILVVKNGQRTGDKLEGPSGAAEMRLLVERALAK